ncbi:hypothetical protein BDR22DRAFT_894164 [Usnea florida]
MASTFAQAWDLLLSDPSHSHKPSSIFPSPSTPLAAHFTPPRSRHASGSEQVQPFIPLGTPPSPPSPTTRSTQAAHEQAKTVTRPRKLSSNSQSVAEEQASEQEPFTPDATRLLQSLRHTLKSLQCSSGSVRDEQDTLTITLLNRKLERLTGALASPTSSAPPPAKDGSSSSDDGASSTRSSSSPLKDDDQDLRCWESCCRGRKFSNKSNFIRHQRERSGKLGKLRCSFCNACFSRSSARNAHEAKRICGPTKSSHSY